MSANLLQPPFALAATGEQIIDFDLRSVGNRVEMFFIITSDTVTGGSGTTTINIADAFAHTAFVPDADSPSLPKILGGKSDAQVSSEGEDYTASITASGTYIKDIVINKSAIAAEIIRITITNNDPANPRTIQIKGNVL